MSQVLVVRDVPAEDVDEVVANFKKIGATEVQITKQPDARYTLRATFPD